MVTINFDSSAQTSGGDDSTATSPPAERSTPGILLIAFRERSHRGSAGRTIPLDGTRSRGRGHRDDSFSSRAGLQPGSAMATEHRSASAYAGHSFATNAIVVPRVGGRLHRPDDAQVEPREAAVGRRAIASVGLLTTGSPRTQSSRRGQRTAASARRCTSRAVRGRRRPPRHCFPDGVGRPPGQEQSSCLGHARDRNARNAIVPERRKGRFVLLSNPRIAGLRFGDQAHVRADTSVVPSRPRSGRPAGTRGRFGLDTRECAGPPTRAVWP